MTESPTKNKVYVAAPRKALAWAFMEANNAPIENLVRVTNESQLYAAQRGEIVWVIGEIDTDTAFALHIAKHKRGLSIKFVECDQKVELSHG
jgi:hypothetical protein